ncbi:Hypothetical protein SRAE_1000314000 [Strongyloides ratti]|uniref:Uncharacterized protein n=1 Tax=Strongyloides ratti TaxID=34506 RepID=A0A090L586_STRRB|nr:Hypothetical protein SRAE_1000314000 [Strongyloides ratti]CEF64887.1 Hypothetical protein SRAE_1000314000 [Strongyloides ratti]
MSFENTYIQSFINQTDSLSDITNVINLNKLNEYHIHKTYKCKESSYVLSRLITDNIKSSQIFCSKYYNHEAITMIEMMKYICNTPEEELEGVTCVKIFISDDTRMLSDDCKTYLAQSYSYFSQFLLNKFENSTELSIINGFGTEKINDLFVFQVIETIKSKNIKNLTGIDINDVISYGKKYNFMENDIFNGMTGLKKLTLTINTTKQSTNLLEYENIIKNFLNYLFKKEIGLNIIFKSDDGFMDKCLNILEYNETIGINIKIDFLDDWRQFFFLYKSNKLNDKQNKVLENLSSVKFYLESFNDFVDLEETINSLKNLETIKINVGGFVQKIVSEESFDYIYSSYYLSHFTHFKCISKSLKCAEISSVYSYSHDDSKMEEVQLFCNYLLEQLISILPETITSLSLLDTSGIEERTFRKISYELPSLTTILFVRCQGIPEESLMEFRELKNVVIYGDNENILDSLDSEITIKGIQRN